MPEPWNRERTLLIEMMIALFAAAVMVTLAEDHLRGSQASGLAPGSLNPV